MSRLSSIYIYTLNSCFSSKPSIIDLVDEFTLFFFFKVTKNRKWLPIRMTKAIVVMRGRDSTSIARSVTPHFVFFFTGQESVDLAQKEESHGRTGNL
jgi:hypothetical protein